MQKSVEFTGKTEEAAIAAALVQLQKAREEVSVEVLQLARTGFLGIGGMPAKVKVTFEVPDEVPDEPPVPVSAEPAVEAEKPEPFERVKRAKEVFTEVFVATEPVEKKPVEKPVEKKEESPAESEHCIPADEDRTQRIDEFLTGLLVRMGVHGTPQISVDAEGNYNVILVGENIGQLIGRRGETLDAIQQLTSYAVNRGRNPRVRIRVDAEQYRAKREESLIRIANRMADKAVRYRRNFTLEPMNAYERHVIHTALQDRPNISTYSIGVEPGRRTVVAYTPDEYPQNRS